ncbi:MAG: acyl-CoA reductase, partial [Pseudomonadota bacterium]
MSDPTDLRTHSFCDSSGGRVDVCLPFDLDTLCAEYDALTARMARHPAPEGFSRAEWGYLLSFMRGAALRSVFTQSFGPVCAALADPPAQILHPPSNIAVWLPNNVSLLGPLVTVLSLLSGADVRAKAGARSENLTARLRDTILQTGAGPELTRLWEQALVTERFDRADPRNARWSGNADARIFFGGDAAAAEVAALPHRPGAPFFGFGHRQSLAWADPDALTDAALETFLRVFQIYGKAGCTSPQRLVLIGGTPAHCVALADKLVALYQRLTFGAPPVHIASDSFMAEQVARARGW